MAATDSRKAALLLAGSTQDPNLEVLGQAAEKQGVMVHDARYAADSGPLLHWVFPDDLSIGGQVIQPSGAFVRYDVFQSMSDPRASTQSRAMGWFQAICGWLETATQVRILNRSHSSLPASKTAVLFHARSAGLRIPRTFVSNDPTLLSGDQFQTMIAKPVAGGGYCESLQQALGSTKHQGDPLPMPAIIQERLSPPDVRVYWIGGQVFAFRIDSERLDYRTDDSPMITYLETPPDEAGQVRKLMDKLGLDFGAADLKTSPAGELVFLELNTSPMFARFDYECRGGIAAAIVRHLCEL